MWRKRYSVITASVFCLIFNEDWKANENKSAGRNSVWKETKNESVSKSFLVILNLFKNKTTFLDFLLLMEVYVRNRNSNSSATDVSNFDFVSLECMFTVEMNRKHFLFLRSCLEVSKYYFKWKTFKNGNSSIKWHVRLYSHLSLYHFYSFTF